jgi:Copper transport outer membrane protein, MctB
VFDFRYHALSLVAVFIALGVGLMLGVVIGDEELISSTKTDLEQSERDRLSSENADLRSELRSREAFEEQAFPALVAGQLAGQRIGLVFLGGASDSVVGDVRDAIDDTGGRLAFVGVVREPPDRASLAARADGTRYEELDGDRKLLRPFAERTGRGLVLAGDLARQARSALLSSFSGELQGIDAVVVARRGERSPDDEDVEAIRDLEEGLVQGMADTGVPVVGVEQTETDPSHISWYRDREIASVDDVDAIAGKAALVFALAGRADGAYGVKSTAEAIMPRLLEGDSEDGGG